MLSIVGVVILIVLLGGFLILRGRTTTQPVDEETSQNQSIPKLSKEELGLTMELSPDVHTVKFSIAKASDLKHIDYEITYDADSTEDESVRVPKGITGEEDVNGATYKTDNLTLGTCSKNVCKYDTGIQKVDLLAKVTKKDGKIYQVEDSVSVEK